MDTDDPKGAIPLDYALPPGHRQRRPSRRDAVIRLLLGAIVTVGLYVAFLWIMFRVLQR